MTDIILKSVHILVHFILTLILGDSWNGFMMFMKCRLWSVWLPRARPSEVPMIETPIFKFVLSEVWWDKGTGVGPWSWAPVWSHLPMSLWNRFSATLVRLNFPRASPYLSLTYCMTMLPQGGLMLCHLTLRAGPGVHWPAAGWQHHSTLGRNWAGTSHPPNRTGTASLQEIAVP